VEEKQRQEQSTTRVQSHPNSRDQLTSIAAFYEMQVKINSSMAYRSRKLAMSEIEGRMKYGKKKSKSVIKDVYIIHRAVR